MSRLKRFAIIGDVHAEDEALAAVLGACEGVDAILCVGDVVDGLGDAERCCDAPRTTEGTRSHPTTRSSGSRRVVTA